MIAQLINLIFSPVIARLFKPEMFGALGVFVSLVGILTPLANLSYTFAVILPPKDEDSILLVRASIVIGIIVSLVIFILIGFLNRQIAHALRLDEYAQYLYFVPIVINFMVITSAYDNWLIRKKHFKTSSAITISQSLLSNLTKVGLGYFFATSASLIGINIFAQVYNALASAFSAKKSIKYSINKTTSSLKLFTKKTLHLLSDYRDFPFYRTPQLIINSLSLNLPIMMLTIFSGPLTAGFYALSHRALKLPAAIIGTSFAKVFEQRVAESAQKGNSIQPLIIKSTLFLGTLGIIPFSIIFVFGPQLFGFVFGNEWYAAGEYARWLSFGLFFALINKPSVKVIPILELQKHFLFFEIVSVIIKTISLALGFLILNNDLLAIGILSISGSLLDISLITFVVITSKNTNRFGIRSKKI